MSGEVGTGHQSFEILKPDSVRVITIRVRGSEHSRHIFDKTDIVNYANTKLARRKEINRKNNSEIVQSHTFAYTQ
jgi:hypothetical protein